MLDFVYSLFDVSECIALFEWDLPYKQRLATVNLLHHLVYHAPSPGYQAFLECFVCSVYGMCTIELSR